MTEDELRELFREMRDEPVPADSQVRVRLAVEGRARSWPERFQRHWKIAAAILVPVCVALIATLSRESARVVVKRVPPVPIEDKAEVPAKIPASDVLAPQVARAEQRVIRTVRRPAAIARSSGSNDSGTVIRIETPDPDVVILLIGG